MARSTRGNHHPAEPRRLPVMARSGDKCPGLGKVCCINYSLDLVGNVSSKGFPPLGNVVVLHCVIPVAPRSGTGQAYLVIGTLCVWGGKVNQPILICTGGVFTNRTWQIGSGRCFPKPGPFPVHGTRHHCWMGAFAGGNPHA